MGMNLRRAMFGAALGILTALCMTALLAWMLLQEIIGIGHMDLLSACILILASAIAALSCGRGEGRMRRITAAEAGLFLALGAVNLVLFDGSLSGLIPCALLIAGTAGAVALASSGKQRRTYGKYGKRKRPTGKLNKKHGR